MKYSKSAIGLLTAQYRSVLKKCWLINAGLFLGVAALATPASAADIVVTDNTAYTGADTSAAVTDQTIHYTSYADGNAMATAINTLNGDSSTNGSVDKKIADAFTSFNTAVVPSLATKADTQVASGTYNYITAGTGVGANLISLNNGIDSVVDKLDDGASGYDIDAKSLKVQGADVVTTTTINNKSLDINASTLKVNDVAVVTTTDLSNSITSSAAGSIGKAISDATGAVETKLGAGAAGYSINANSLKVQGSDVITETDLASSISGTTAGTIGKAISDKIDNAISSDGTAGTVTVTDGTQGGTMYTTTKTDALLGAKVNSADLGTASLNIDAASLKVGGTSVVTTTDLSNSITSSAAGSIGKAITDATTGAGMLTTSNYAATLGSVYEAAGTAAGVQAAIEGKLDDGATGYDIDAKSLKVQGTTVATTADIAGMVTTTTINNKSLDINASTLKVNDVAVATTSDVTTAINNAISSDGTAGTVTVTDGTQGGTMYTSTKTDALLGAKVNSADLGTASLNIDAASLKVGGATVATSSDVSTAINNAITTDTTAGTVIVTDGTDTGTMYTTTKTDALLGAKVNSASLADKTLNINAASLKVSDSNVVTETTINNKTLDMNASSLKVNDVDVVTVSGAQTLTNKTIDASSNAISNLGTGNFASGVIQTTVRAVSSASDTAIASEKAVATAIDDATNFSASSNTKVKGATAASNTVKGALSETNAVLNNILTTAGTEVDSAKVDVQWNSADSTLSAALGSGAYGSGYKVTDGNSITTAIAALDTALQTTDGIIGTPQTDSTKATTGLLANQKIGDSITLINAINTVATTAAGTALDNTFTGNNTFSGTNNFTGNIIAGTGTNTVTMNGSGVTATTGSFTTTSGNISTTSGDISTTTGKIKAGTDITLDGSTGEVKGSTLTSTGGINAATTITAGTGANAITMNGTNASLTAGTGTNVVSIDGKNATVTAGTGTNAITLNGTTGAITGVSLATTSNITTTNGNISTTNGNISAINGSIIGKTLANADGSFSVNATGATTVASLNTAGNITTTAGTITAGTGANTVAINGTSGITVSTGNIEATSGNIIAGTGTNTVTMNGSGVTATTGSFTTTSGNFATTSGNFTTASGNFATTSGNISTANGNVTAGTGSNLITLNGGTGEANALTVTARGALSAGNNKFQVAADGSTTTITSATTNNGTFTVNDSTGANTYFDINASGQASFTRGSDSVVIDNGTNALTVTGKSALNGDTTVGTLFKVTAADGTTVVGNTSGSNVQLKSDGTVTATSTVKGNDFTNTAGSFVVDASGNTSAQSLAFNGDTAGINVNSIDQGAVAITDGNNTSAATAAARLKTMATNATIATTVGDLASQINTNGVTNVADVTSAISSLAKNVTDATGGTFSGATWTGSVTVNPASTNYATTSYNDIMSAVSQVASNIGNEVTDTNNGVSATATVNANISQLNTIIGNTANLGQDITTAGTSYHTMNALSNGTGTAPTTVVEALNNVSATLGDIHGLASKLEAEGKYQGNLASGTTVEQHLSALDTAIGDRSRFAQTHYATDANSVVDAVTKLDTSLYDLDHDVRALRHHFEAGMASAAALSALVPNAKASGNTQLSVGTGAYRGHTAIAAGGFHWINDNLLLNAGVAWDSNEATYRMGVTYSW